MSKCARKKIIRNQIHREWISFKAMIALDESNATNRVLSEFYRSTLERKAETEAYDRAYERSSAGQTPNSAGQIDVGMCHQAGVEAVKKVVEKAERDAAAKRAKRAGLDSPRYANAVGPAVAEANAIATAEFEVQSAS